MEIQDVPSFDLSFQAPSQSPRVGDILRIEVVGAKEADLSLSLPEGSSPWVELGYVLHQKELLLDQGKIFLEVIPIQGGELKIDTLLLKKGEQIFGRTKPVTIKIQEEKANESAQLTEFYPPELVSFPVEVAVAGSLLILTLLGLLGYYLFKVYKRRAALKKEANLPLPRRKTEDEIALEKFEKLRGAGLLEKQNFKKFYYRASEIMKEYLDARFRFNALESTTEEIADHLIRVVASGEINSSQRQELWDLFREMDFVKFADKVPTSARSLEILDRLVSFVGQTKRHQSPVLSGIGGENAIR